MLKRNRLISLILSIALILSMLPVSVFANEKENNLSNFLNQKEYTTNVFTDIKTDDWFYGNVKTSCQLRLMKGNSATTFNPNGYITLAETITIAARLHSIYYTGKDTFQSSNPWYKIYVDYAIDKGIISEPLSDYNKKATRAEFATILASSLPEEALKEINNVANNAIPDVRMNNDYAKAVYTLYRAGILVGNDVIGTFTPNSNIMRHDVAAIVSRMADISLRKSIQLGKEYTVTFDLNYTGGAIEKSIVFEGKCATEPSKPTRDGYTFLGWYTTNTDNTKFDFSTKIISNLTLYAKWEEDSTVWSPQITGGNNDNTEETILTPDSPFLNPDNLDGDITRQEWVSKLVESAKLTMYKTDLNSSFSDVDIDNPFSWPIEIALMNNAISISEGDNKRFYPKYAATEAFVVVSTVRALGFIYKDLDDCYKIANDCGIFTGTPTTKNATVEQVDTALDAIKEIIKPVNIDSSAEQIINYADTTKVLDKQDIINTYSYDERTKSGNVHLDKIDSINIGDCIILPQTDKYTGGLAQKVTAIHEQDDGTIILDTTIPNIDEVMGDGEIKIQGTAKADPSKAIISDEIMEKYNIVYKNNKSDTLYTNESSTNAKPHINITHDYVEIEFSEELSNKIDAVGKAKLYFPDVNYNIDLDWSYGVPVGVNNFYLALNNKATCEGDIEVTGSKNNILNGKELLRLPIQLGGGFTVDVVLFIGLSASGKASIAYELETTVGIEYKNNHLRTINKYKSNVDFTAMETEFEFGPNLSAIFTLCSVFDLADITASTGLGINASAIIRDNTHTCADSTAYIYLNLSALKNSLIGDFINCSFSKTIWDKDNSIWNKSLHYEKTPNHTGVVPECTFGEGEVIGIVKDASTNYPISCFEIKAIKSDGNDETKEISAIISENGSFIINNLSTGSYKIIISASGYKTLVKENVIIKKNQTTNIGTLRLISSNVTTGSASGYIIDSQTGNPICNAKISLYYGDNTLSSADISTFSEADGKYILSNIPAGNYTITIEKENYTTGTRSIIISNSSQENQNVTLIPIGINDDYDTSVDIGTYTQIGDLRIVLTWGKTPHDLDSHLCGPTNSGASRFHIYFDDRYYEEDNHVYSFLDHDDINSYGPETTTVYDINTCGKYSFYVHDYTNADEIESLRLAESDATVRVYVKEATGIVNENGEALYRAKLIGIFYVPYSEGTLWYVFDYNAATGTLTPRNLMTYDSESSNVGIYSLSLGNIIKTYKK